MNLFLDFGVPPWLGFGAPPWAFGLALIALIIGIGWRWPLLLLALALASLAIRPELLFGGHFVGWRWELHHTLMVLALTASAWRFGLQKSIPWPIAALALSAALSLLFGRLHPHVGPGLVVESLVLLSLPFAFTQISLPLRTRSVLAPLIMALPLLSTAIGAALQIAGLHVTFAHLHDRLEGATGNAGVFGLLAFCGLAVALHEISRQKYPSAILPAALNLALVVFSGSRSAMLASGLLLIAYPLASAPFRSQLRQRPLVMSTGAILAAGISVAYLPKIYERLHLKMDRFRVWNVFYDEFLKSPVFGRGSGAGLVAGDLWPADVERPFLTIPHNEYLHLLVNGGMIGFALCLAAIIYWYYRSIRLTSAPDRCFLIALAPALAAFAVTENILIHAYSLGLFVYIGLLDRPETSAALGSMGTRAPTESGSAGDGAEDKEERSWADGAPPRPQ
ncbi:MAG: O-antigen ligase family protein [Geminicoccaceae bacterium]